MGDLEKFIHNEEVAVPHLIKIALVHYQFETIHPFLDGNGRIGRLLIPLYLLSHKIIEKPVLYLSVFFEKHKVHYYDNLMHVRRNNDLIQWIKFFLVGVAETCEIASGSYRRSCGCGMKYGARRSSIWAKGRRRRRNCWITCLPSRL